MNIGGIDIGAGYPCRTIAEISNNHNGDLSRAIALISAAKEAGADLVKAQCYLPEELVALRGDGPAPEPWGSQGYTMGSLYEEAKTPLQWLPTLFAEAKRFEIPLFASVFGAKSLAACEAVGCPAYKISHFEFRSSDLIRMVRETGKPLVVSLPKVPLACGFTEKVAPDVGLLSCPGGYPAERGDMHLRNMVGMLGLSSHCKDPLVAPVAVARGAKLLEFHFMLSWAPSKLESNVSLTEIEFRDMVQSVRRTEELLG